MAQVLFDMPETAGAPIGRGVGVVAVSVNVHYTDGQMTPGAVSQDGIRIFYTPTLRPQTVALAATFGIFQVPDVSGLNVPPGRQRYFLTKSCHVEDPCKDMPQSSLAAIIGVEALTCDLVAVLGQCKALHVLCPKSCQICTPGDFQGSSLVGVTHHGHLLGMEMYDTLTREGVTRDLGSQPIWNYNDQSQRLMTTWNVTVKPGDVIQSTCVFNSTQRRRRTRFSLETTDEMCITTFSALEETNKYPIAPHSSTIC